MLFTRYRTSPKHTALRPLMGFDDLRGSLLPRYSDWGSRLGKWAQVRDSFPGRRAAQKRNGMGRQSPYSLSFAGPEVIGRIQRPWTPSSSLSKPFSHPQLVFLEVAGATRRAVEVLSELARDEKEEEEENEEDRAQLAHMCGIRAHITPPYRYYSPLSRLWLKLCNRRLGETTPMTSHIFSRLNDIPQRARVVCSSRRAL